MDTDLQNALRLHQAGRIEQAAGLYDAVLQRDPNHADALHLRGVAAHQLADHLRAVELIGQAITRKPNSAAYYCNLAEAERALGRLADAEGHCRDALRLRPNYPEALHNLGVVLSRLERASEAEIALRDSLRLKSDSAQTVSALADALRKQGRLEESLKEYERALSLNSSLMDAHANYGLLLMQRGELEKGLAHCRQAVQLQPASATAQHNLGRLLLECGYIDEAQDALAEAIRLDPRSPTIADSIGLIWLELGDFKQARSWLERALTLDPGFAEARCHFGELLLDFNNPEGAAEVYRGVLASEPQRADALIGLSRSLLEQGDVEAAAANQREAIRLYPEAPGPHAGLGHILSTAGDIRGVVASFRRALALNENCVPGLVGLMTTERKSATNEDVHRAEALLTAPWTTDGRRASLHFGLAQVFDGRSEYGLAAKHMVDANALQLKHWVERDQKYCPESHHEHVERLISAFTPEYFRRVADFGLNDARPVFVVGMPRSGTTLTEQILASHPEIHGAGERRFVELGLQVLPQAVDRPGPPAHALEHVTRDAVQRIADWHLGKLVELAGERSTRIVDKMPDNYQMLGWIVTLFPNAKIIWCRRDVRDVALSCWLTHFTRIRWANDLEHLADRINEYFRIHDHYRKILPRPIFEIEYEQLVADQEGVSRKLLDFVGLDWRDECLEFHRTERLVRTASVSQVRQPIYQRSVARWRHYEAMLQPLLERLKLPATSRD